MTVEINSQKEEENISRFATAFIFNPEKQLLIARRREEAEILPGKWGYPGGTIEPGQTTEDATNEEIKTETGLSVKIIKIGKECGVNIGTKTIIVIPVLCETNTSEVVLDYEHTEFKWISPKDLLSFDLGVPKNDVTRMTESIGLNIQ